MPAPPKIKLIIKKIPIRKKSKPKNVLINFKIYSSINFPLRGGCSIP
jgi:hypothetical protein